MMTRPDGAVQIEAACSGVALIAGSLALVLALAIYAFIQAIEHI